MIKLDEHQERVLSLVEKGSSLFVTGKAGTGKTTLLEKVVSVIQRAGKEVVVLAPTGVAAKNAHGMTIHAFTHITTKPYIPGPDRKPEVYKALDDEYVRYLKRIDVVIIDEVSMVRCDVMDALDATLRHYRGKKSAFGGVQIVLFGDLYQLMPVAVNEDEKTLDNHYSGKNYYFFNSDVIRKNPLPKIELQTIYRQGKDKKFAELLNRVREGFLSSPDKRDLDKRYDPDFNDENVILLTTHNNRAIPYNDSKLKELRGRVKEYVAVKTGVFPTQEYPTSYKLELKKGARVMFIKNDTTHAKQWYINGTLATVETLGEGYVRVKTDDGLTVDVTPATWNFDYYTFSKTYNKVIAETIGSFTQLPLKLAWAMTIHKSQGLTFEKVAIDASKSFAYGQVYVALSRCTSLKGITLVSKIDQSCVSVDPLVVAYMNDVENAAGSGVKTTTNKSKLTALKTKQTTDLYLYDERFGDSVNETLARIRKGDSVQKIAKDRRIKEDTVYSHIVELIEAGEADVYDFVDMDKVDEIMMAMTFSADRTLSSIKENCYIDVSYNEIKMVRAYWDTETSKLDYYEEPEIPTEPVVHVKPVVQNTTVKNSTTQLSSTQNSPAHYDAWEEQQAYIAKLYAQIKGIEYIDPKIEAKKLADQQLEKQRKEQQEKEAREKRLREEAELQAMLKEEEERKAREKEENMVQEMLHQKRIVSPLTLDHQRTTLMLCYREYKGDIVVPEGVKTIFVEAFNYCKYINKVVLPKTVTSIENAAFKRCGCTEVVMPDSLKEIGDYAFKGCNNLHSIIIPASIVRLGREILSECSNLDDIYINVSNPDIYNLNKAFVGIQNYSPVIHVPKGHLNEYLRVTAFKGVRVIDDIMSSSFNKIMEPIKKQTSITWTLADDQTLKELFDGGLSAEDIADLMNRREEEISLRLQYMNPSSI